MNIESTVNQGTVQLALSLALSALGKTDPNPPVGAVIYDEVDLQILGTGVTQSAGRLHAEVSAIENAELHYGPGICEGKTLYVTLEPCNHIGKTPPCTEKIIERKINRVVYLAKDDNPNVHGKGHEALHASGIAVTFLNYNHPWLDFLHLSFQWASQHKQALGILKWAQDSNGFVAPQKGSSGPISGNVAREFMHRTRALCGAVLATPGTVKLDRPMLTPRFGKLSLEELYDGSALMEAISQVVRSPAWGSSAHNPKQIFCLPKSWDKETIREFRDLREKKDGFNPVYVVRSQDTWDAIGSWPESSICIPQEKIDFSQLFSYFNQALGLNHTLIEAGPIMIAEFLKYNFVQKIIVLASKEEKFLKGKGNGLTKWLAAGRSKGETKLGFQVEEIYDTETDSIYLLRRITE